MTSIKMANRHNRIYLYEHLKLCVAYVQFPVQILLFSFFFGGGGGKIPLPERISLWMRLSLYTTSLKKLPHTSFLNSKFERCCSNSNHPYQFFHIKCIAIKVSHIVLNKIGIMRYGLFIVFNYDPFQHYVTTFLEHGSQKSSYLIGWLLWSKTQ